MGSFAAIIGSSVVCHCLFSTHVILLCQWRIQDFRFGGGGGARNRQRVGKGVGAGGGMAPPALAGRYRGAL